MMLKSAAAGPVGRRRSCSQFWRVFTLTPTNRANSDCERLVRWRIARTPGPSITVLREGFFGLGGLLRLRGRFLEALRTSFSSLTEFLFDKLRDLFRGQILPPSFGCAIAIESYANGGWQSSGERTGKCSFV
jgi:hypothetical protein